MQSPFAPRPRAGAWSALAILLLTAGGPAAAYAQQTDSAAKPVPAPAPAPAPAAANSPSKPDCNAINQKLVAAVQKKGGGSVSLTQDDIGVPTSDLMQCMRPAAPKQSAPKPAASGVVEPLSLPVAPVAGDTACQIQIAPIGKVLPASIRAKSPLDSITFRVGEKPVKICYGRPSARGRTMIGGASVPYGKLWRTGANEPTTIMTPIPLTIAGIAVPAGIYSLYTVPGAKQWQVIVNRSYSQWGVESAYTDSVKAKEVGRGTVKSETTQTPVETFTIRSEPAAGGKDGKAVSLILEWEKTRVRIPVKAR